MQAHNTVYYHTLVNSGRNSQGNFPHSRNRRDKKKRKENIKKNLRTFKNRKGQVQIQEKEAEKMSDIIRKRRNTFYDYIMTMDSSRLKKHILKTSTKQI